MKISDLYAIFKEYPTVTTDTRNCPPDSIFIALKGANFNGNAFAKQALDLGCRYAVVDEEEYATHPNILLVDDCLKALQDLANYHRRQFKIPILGVTGSNGKTTTKELILSVLSQEYNVIATQGNYNNHIGVPLTLLRITKEHEIAIIEMGASHLGEIETLARIAEPNFGLITNIGRAHLEGFGSYENIKKGKSELYDFIRTTKEGKVFVDSSNEVLMDLAEGMTIIPYAFGDNKDELFVTGRVLASSPFLKMEWCMASTCFEVETNIVGTYNLSNALAAVTIGKYFGVKSELICRALETYEPRNNRSQLKETGRNMLIIDAYNANPTSMKAALDNFTSMEVNNKVLILGDMKELGPDSDVEHQKIADMLVCNGFEQVLLVGENFSHVETKYSRYKDFLHLKDFLVENPIKNSYVLLKGSRGMHLEDCIELL